MDDLSFEDWGKAEDPVVHCGETRNDGFRGKKANGSRCGDSKLGGKRGNAMPKPVIKSRQAEPHHERQNRLLLHHRCGLDCSHNGIKGRQGSPSFA